MILCKAGTADLLIYQRPGAVISVFFATYLWLYGNSATANRGKLAKCCSVAPHVWSAMNSSLQISLIVTKHKHTILQTEQRNGWPGP